MSKGPYGELGKYVASHMHCLKELRHTKENMPFSVVLTNLKILTFISVIFRRRK